MKIGALVGRTITKHAGRVAGSLLVLCITGFGAGNCFADTINFYPSSSSGDTTLGTSATFNGTGADKIVVSAFECDNSRFGFDTGCLSGTHVASGVTVDSADVHIKNDGTNEKGAGVAGDPDGDNEISADTFLDLDMTHLGATTGTLTISSLQNNESFFFCYGNSNSGWNSNACTSVVTGGFSGNNVTESFNMGSYTDISLIGVNGDVLLASVGTTASPTPEPGSLTLLGTGLLGLVGMMKRRLGATS